MARKRAPGAGRPPRGEIRRKETTFTTRITLETRAALDHAAKDAGISVSQEAEYCLKFALRKNPIHIQALGEMITLLTRRIESKTKKNWNEDVFTSEALRRGIEVLVLHFAPRGTSVTPISVEDAAAKMPGNAGEAYGSPAGVGETEAGQVMAWIEISNFRDLKEITSLDLNYPKEWYLHEQIFNELRPGGKHAREKTK